VNALGVIYKPLDWLDRNVPGQPISKYARLWH
jgi:hypothetical protein